MALYPYVSSNLSNIEGKALGTENVPTLYYSLFLPIFSYCCEMWGLAYASTIHCIEILQKRVIRLTNGVDRQCHTKKLFSRCVFLKFKYLVHLKVLLSSMIFNNMPMPNNTQGLFNQAQLYIVIDPNVNIYVSVVVDFFYCLIYVSELE